MYILDNGEQLDLTENEADVLVDAELIYACNDTVSGCNCFHLSDGVTFEQVESFIGLEA